MKKLVVTFQNFANASKNLGISLNGFASVVVCN